MIEITIDRLIDATPEEIYEVWLDKNSPASPWFGVPKVILNPQVDGLFYSMYQVEDIEIAHYGRFITLEKPHKIQYTWVSEATHGKESLLTVTLKPKDGKTEVFINNNNIPDDEGGKQHLNAWSYVISRMQTHFVNQKKVKSE